MASLCKNTFSQEKRLGYKLPEVIFVARHYTRYIKLHFASSLMDKYPIRYILGRWYVGNKFRNYEEINYNIDGNEQLKSCELFYTLEAAFFLF